MRDPAVAPLRLLETVSIDELGAKVGLSERSVIRLFPRETGLTFGRWHNRRGYIRGSRYSTNAIRSRRLRSSAATPDRAPSQVFRRTMGDTPTGRLQGRTR